MDIVFMMYDDDGIGAEVGRMKPTVSMEAIRHDEAMLRQFAEQRGYKIHVFQNGKIYTKHKLMTLACGGFNWTWYIELEMMDDGVKIHKHYRLHDERDKHPEYSGTFNIIESQDKERIALKVVVRELPDWKEKTYDVTNPKYVFSYGE
jgi:hypothetical protein